MSSRTVKGYKRSELEIAKQRVSMLNNGWKTMLLRHQEEMIKQQAKIKAAKEALAELEKKETN